MGQRAAPTPAPRARVVRVVPDVRAVERPFDYLVPADMGRPSVGTEVRVELHGRRVRGWIIGVDVTPPPGVRLRSLSAVRGQGPPPSVVDLAFWAAWRWAGSPAAFLGTASSPTVVRLAAEHANAGGGAAPGGAPEPTTGTPPSGSAAEQQPSRTSGGAGAEVGPGAVGGPGAVVGPGAVGGAAGLGGAKDRAGSWVDGDPSDPAWWAEVLVEGTSIVRLGPQADRRPLLVEVGRRVLDSGEGAVVVVPEGVDIPRVAAVLRAAGAPVAVLPEAWAVARRGGVVAVGTRRAVWAPLPRVGAMVVLDAHDHSLVEQRRPSWSATAVAIERARRDGAPCVVVSPCPPVAMTVLGRPWRPSRVAERASWPVVEVVDLRTTDPRLGLLTERVTALVRWAVGAEDGRGSDRDVRGGDGNGRGHDGSRQRSGGSGVARRVGLVLNRPGGARLVVCGACRAVARCDACGRALTLVDDAAGQHLRCRWCQGVQPVICMACGSTKVVGRRPGVATLRRHVEALAGVVVTEVAGADPARRPPPDRWTSVVVGTEAMLHGDTGFDAVVLLDIDDGLLAPRLGAGEATLALVARAARAVRRSQVVVPPRRGAGVVVVQTREADHPAVRAAVAGDPDLLVQAELPVRDQLRWPPATAVAVMDGPGAPALADAIVRAAGAGVAIEVSGPLDGRWTLRAPNAAALCDALALRHGVAGRVRIDVDPVDL